MTNPAEGLDKFFTRMWGTDQEGYVYLPSLSIQETSSGEGALAKTRLWQPKWFRWPKSKVRVIEYVMLAEAQNRDVYFSPAIYEIPDRERPEATKQKVIGTRWVWADFDGNAPKDWNSDLVPPPSIRVSTSVDGHEHVYWELEEFQTNWKVAESFSRTIAAAFSADSGGWDITQVLRPPYTTNFGRGKGDAKDKDRHPTVVKYTDYRETRYRLSDFKIDPIKASASIGSVEILNELPQVVDVVAKYAWDADTWEMFRKEAHELVRKDGKGLRSDALMRLGYFGAERGMSDSEIYALLLHADNRWEKFKHRPPESRHNSLLQIIAVARERYPVGSMLLFNGLMGSSGSVQGLVSFLEHEEHIEWTVENMLQTRGYGLITSQPGVGKTQFSLQLGLHIATGADFLKWKIPVAKRVLFLSLEMAGPELQFILKTMVEDKSTQELSILEENFQVLATGEPLMLLTERGQNYLQTVVENHKPDVLIIDSLGQVVDKVDDVNVKHLGQYLQRFRIKYNVAVWMVHHNRKANQDNKEPKELSDVYGSQYITSFPEFIISLWQTKGHFIEVNNIKSRLVPMFERFQVQRTPTLGFEMENQARMLEAPLFKGELEAGKNPVENKDEGNGELWGFK